MKRSFNLLSVILAVVLVVVFWFGLSRGLDDLTLDALFRVRGSQAVSDDIVIVALHEDFLAEYQVRVGEIDRRFYATVINRLAEAGARAIALDVFFPEVSNERSDSLLAESILSAAVTLPHVPLGQERSLRRLSIEDHVPFHPLLSSANRGVLFTEAFVRQMQPTLTFADGELPIFSLALLQTAGLRPTGLSVKRLVDYRGPVRSFPWISFLDVVNNTFAYSDVKDKLVLIGVTVAGTDSDQFLTPFGLMPGIEIHANQAYTLLYGDLQAVPRLIYLLLLLGIGAFWPRLAMRRRGLSYSLLLMLGIAVIALVLFFLGWFLPPVLLLLMALLSYTVTSYDSLLGLDKVLTERMQNLFMTLQLGSSTVTDGTAVGSDILKGFTPIDEMRDAPDMLMSLVEALGGEGGLLILGERSYQYGSAQDSLAALAREAMTSTHNQAQGNFPHHLAKVLVRNREDRANSVIGALVLALPAPPPPHLDELITESASSFVQLAQYRQLRSRTTTMADTIWPWQTQSSMDKIEAISVIADLLTTERSWLGTLLEALPQAVFITSPYGYSIYKNAAARRLFGEERHMLKAIPQMLKIDADDFQQDYVRTVEQAESLELGTTERASERPVMLTLKVVMVDNRVRGVAGLVSDLSKIEALNRQRQEMISMVVHDLRSPLTSIMGFSEFLLDDDSISEDIHEVLRIINDQSGRMKRLTDEVLEYSRLESGQVNPVFVVENVVEILRHVVASVSPQASEKKMSLSISAPDFVGVKLDPDLMSRVLTNLLSNAVKYSPENTRVTCKVNLDADDYIIEVIDQGFGISEAQLQKLFGKYQRIEDGPHAAIEGTGLGLYLVKLIVEAHQGKIDVRSRVNEGSSFILTLPVDPEVAGT